MTIRRAGPGGVTPCPRPPSAPLQHADPHPSRNKGRRTMTNPDPAQIPATYQPWLPDGSPEPYLTREQAAYHLISGYTAKLAGTEVGVKEPKATFSACFGAPFMPRHPGEYAAMLVERLERWDVPVWLVNTGWTGGPYGVGERMNIAHTRSMVRAALDGRLDEVPTRLDPIFRVEVPLSCPAFSSVPEPATANRAAIFPLTTPPLWLVNCPLLTSRPVAPEMLPPL